MSESMVEKESTLGVVRHDGRDRINLMEIVMDSPLESNRR